MLVMRSKCFLHLFSAAVSKKVQTEGSVSALVSHPQGNDDIYICGLSSAGNVDVQRAFSVGRKAPNVQPKVLHPLQDILVEKHSEVGS